MVAFALVLAASDYFEGHAAALLALRFAVPLLVFLFFLSRGSYPELGDFRPGWDGLALDVLFGLLVMGVWVAPYLIWPSVAPAAKAFDPAAAGEDWGRFCSGSGLRVLSLSHLLSKNFLFGAI